MVYISNKSLDYKNSYSKINLLFILNKLKSLFFSTNVVDFIFLKTYFYSNSFTFVSILLLNRFFLNPQRYLVMFRSYSPFYWSIRTKKNWKMLSFLKKNTFLLKNINLIKNSSKFWKKSINIKLLIKTKKYYSIIKRRNSLLRFAITLTRKNKIKKKLNFIIHSQKEKTILKKKTSKIIFFLKLFFFKKKKSMFRRPLFFKKNFMKSLSENRLLWRFFFFFKFKRQFYMNKFISQAVTSKTIHWFLSFELSVFNILLRSKLCLTRQQSRDFIKLGYVYVNGQPTKSIFKKTKINDVAQVIYNIKFFFNWRYIYSTLLKASFRLGYCLWRLYRNKGNFFKQRSHHIPSWVNKLMFFKLNTPKYLEVDYTTLSVFILRNPTNMFEFSIYTIKYFNLFLFRLYNWKYVI